MQTQHHTHTGRRPHPTAHTRPAQAPKRPQPFGILSQAELRRIVEEQLG